MVQTDRRLGPPRRSASTSKMLKRDDPDSGLTATDISQSLQSQLGPLPPRLNRCPSLDALAPPSQRVRSHESAAIGLRHLAERTAVRAGFGSYLRRNAKIVVGICLAPNQPLLALGRGDDLRQSDGRSKHHSCLQSDDDCCKAGSLEHGRPRRVSIAMSQMDGSGPFGLSEIAQAKTMAVPTISAMNRVGNSIRRVCRMRSAIAVFGAS